MIDKVSKNDVKDGKKILTRWFKRPRLQSFLFEAGMVDNARGLYSSARSYCKEKSKLEVEKIYRTPKSQTSLIHVRFEVILRNTSNSRGNPN